MEKTPNLRPIEKLFMLSFEKNEEWSAPNAIAAVLAFFIDEGLATVANKEIIITRKGEDCLFKEKFLFGYEILALNAIRSADFSILIEVFESQIPKKSLLNQGFLEYLPRFSNLSKKINCLNVFQLLNLTVSGRAKIIELINVRDDLTLLPRSEQLKNLSSLAVYPSLFHPNQEEIENKEINHIISIYAWAGALEAITFFKQGMTGAQPI